MNISNELLFIEFPSRLPGLPVSERQGYVLFKRTIIISIESDSQGITIMQETLKLFTLLYISLQTCVNNNGDNFVIIVSTFFT